MAGFGIGEGEEAQALEVCNGALLELGQKVLARKLLGDGLSPNEQVCAAKYPGSRMAVLRAHPWGFAGRFMGVGCVPAPGSFDGFRFRFRRPADCVTVLGVDGRLAFSVIGGWVYVRRPVCGVKYIRNVVDLGEWPADVRELLVKRVAMDIAMAVCGAAGIVSEAERRYLVALGDAKRMDSEEGQEFDFEGMDPISAAMESAMPRIDWGAWEDAVEGRVSRW